MKIEHVAMYVRDLEAAKSFFITYFNGQANQLYHNQKTGFKSYFISFEAGPRLELMFMPETIDHDKSVRKTGFVHIAFSVGSVDKVNQMTDILKEKGYQIFSQPRHTGDGYYESCILDIEGNQIEITV